MAKLTLNVGELHVETFEALQAETQEHAAVGTRVNCPPTQYVTCYYATPRQEDFRLTAFCC